MNSMEQIAPGTAVHSTDGVVGVVEGHDGPLQEGETADGVLVVRSHDGTRRYRLPATLIRRVALHDGQQVVVLQASSAMVEGYVADVRSPEERAGLKLAASAELVKTRSAASEQWAPQSGQDTLRLPLFAEELEVQTQPISLGRVHVHKGVETVEQHLTLPVFREEALIERIAPEDYDASAPVGPDELIIPIVEEKIVFEKRTVVKEYIRIRKRRVQEEQELKGTVRREFLEVTEQPREGQESQGASLFRVQ